MSFYHIGVVYIADLHELSVCVMSNKRYTKPSVSLFRLGSGTSRFASATIGNFRSSVPELAVVTESARLYRELHHNGHDIGDLFMYLFVC